MYPTSIHISWKEKEENQKKPGNDHLKNNEGEQLDMGTGPEMETGRPARRSLVTTSCTNQYGEDLVNFARSRLQRNY